MKYVPCLLTILVTAPCLQAQERYQSVNAEEFNQLLEESENAVILDVRTPQEYNSGHIKGAINLNYYAADFVEKIKELDRGKVYLIYCHSGRRSFSAASIFLENGFNRIYDLRGGISNNRTHFEVELTR